MPERTESKTVECSCRLYEWLLKLYPKAHREEYGVPMLRLFRDQCRDAWNEKRTRGLIVFWLRVLPDLLKTSILEHLSNLGRRQFVLKLFVPRLRPFFDFPAFAVAFLVILLTSILIAFLTPNSFRSTAQIDVDENQPDSRTEPSAPSILPPDYLQTESTIIKSHAVLSKAVDALNLREVWGHRGKPLGSDRAETILRRNVDLALVRNTKIVEVSAFSRNPDEAARLANGVVDAYRAYTESLANKGAAARTRAVRILSPAEPDLRPFRPNRPLIVFLGIMISIVCGLIAGTVSVRTVTLFGERALAHSGQPRPH